MADALQSIPGLAGYLSMQQHQQQQAQGELRQVMGLASLLQRQQEVQQRAQLAPLQAQLLQAQVGQAQGLADQRQREGAFNQALPGLVQQATGENGQLDMSRLSGLLMQTPGGLKPGMDLRRTEEDRAARVQQAQQLVAQRTAVAQQAHEARMSQLQRQQDRDAEMARHARTMEGLQAQTAAIASMNASRPGRDPLVQVEMDDPNNPGKKVLRYVPQSQAAGMSPPSRVQTDKPLTEFQGKAVLFGTRMAQSDKILRELEDNISVSGLAAKQAAERTPVIGGILGVAGNMALSDKQQRVDQAQRDFLNAVLRKESGAVIGPSEFESGKKQYFPQPGDSKDVIAQKRNNREIAINGLKRMAGPGGNEIDMIRSAPLLPGGESAGSTGEWSIQRKQ